MAADFVAVILAAGKGTRLVSRQAKVLHRIGGRALVEHVVRACLPLRAKTLVVVGHQPEEVGAVVSPFGARTILQQPQRGTGHALQAARRAIGSHGKYGLVVPGDAPLIGSKTLAALVGAHRRSEAAATILTAVLENPAGYGRILRKQNGEVAAIVEEGALTEDQRSINEVNSSIYCFTLSRLWPCLAQLRPENVHRELYLTDAIALLNQHGEKVLAQVAADPREILGCNTRAELAEVDRVFRERKRAALMDSGVTIYLPETVLVDPDVVVGADTVIEPGVQLLGRTRIGERCTIRTGSVLSDVVLDEGVTVRQHCVIASSHLGKNSVVGPFAHLRDGAELRPGARVGNYVEVKKSVLEEGVKAMHLSYIGDARVGRETNIGAGTITCNYDGVRKNRTAIGRRVFVGSDTALVAPVKVGDGAYIAAGSTITEDVPSNALAIARGRQETKPGWATKRRAEMALRRSLPRAKPRGSGQAAAASPSKKIKPRRKARPKPKSRRRPAR